MKIYFFVTPVGVEPTLFTESDPKSDAAANYATGPNLGDFRPFHQYFMK